MKTKKADDENKLNRFGGQFVTSLSQVQDKILRKEKKVDEIIYLILIGQRVRKSNKLKKTKRKEPIIN